MLTSEILKRAKTRLTPSTWGQGYQDLVRGKTCAGLAFGWCKRDDVAHLAARAILHAVTTGSPYGSIACWNDAPGRTLQDVYDAFDAAIAIALSREQAHPASDAAVAKGVEVL